MKLARHEQMLFALLGHAINGKGIPEQLFRDCGNDGWERCYALACDQGVMAIAWDSVMTLPPELQPDRPLKLKWALAVEKYSEVYGRYCAAVAELSAFYAGHGIRTVQMKGVGLSTYYPVPERRQGGDIDIFTYSSDTSVLTDVQANELADRLMRDKGIEVNMHTYKHSNFYYKGIPVENHKCFANVRHYKAAEAAEKLLHEYFNPCRAALPGGFEIMIPSPEFNSVFIILHALQHFMSGLVLHHLCDWACVLKKIGPELPLSLDDSRFTASVRAINNICAEYLGTDIPKEEGLEGLSDIIMKEMLHPKYWRREVPSGRLRILWYKIRRFAYSARLRAKVWNIGIAEQIWQSVVSHVRKPETIFMR